MKCIATEIPDVWILEPKVFGDARGFFMETWNARTFAAAGIDTTFVQDNHSASGPATLRGLHYQVKQTQGKLVRALRGAIFDVAVDLRRSSPTFKRWVGVELTETNRRQLWVPPGFAHGFCVIGEGAEIMYKCTDFYAPEHDRTLLWSDPTIGITWPLPPGTEPVLSEKDRAGQLLDDADVFP